MTKASEMSREAFGIAVGERISELRNKALAAGVPKEQIEEIISSVYSQTQDLSLTTAVNRIKNAIGNKIEAASATLIVGAIVGSRDVVGKKMPIRYLLITKDKKHVEISNFGTKAQYQGEQIEIPVPALVEVRATHDAEYDSWNLKEIVKYRVIDRDGLIKVLSSVVVPVKSITKEMAYEKGKSSGKPVVLTGKMNYFRTEVTFKPRDENEPNKKAEVDHPYPILMPREFATTEGDVLPCFQFALTGKGHGANSIRGHLPPMRYGTPYVDVEDIIPISTRAIEKNRNKPEGQAEYLQEWLKDVDVIVAGTVNKFAATYTEDRQERNYIDVAVSCVVGLPSPLEEMGQKTLTQAPAKGVPHITTETPPIQTQPAQFIPDQAPAQAPAPAPAQAPQPTGGDNKFMAVVKAIKLYSRAAGTKPSAIDIPTMKSKALDMFDGIPDAVIQEAIEFIKATEAATGS